jgi:Ca2+-binding RTX toxin-like protein
LAFVDAYVSLNMLNGFDFTNLNYGESYYEASDEFSVYYSDWTSESLYGYGFTYDYYGNPTGYGTVTDYEATDCDGSLFVGVYGISVPASWIVNASNTYSTADDFAIIRTALAGNDTIWGSDYADVLDGFNGNDIVKGYDGNDTVYGEAGNDYLDGMTGNDYLNGGAGADQMIGGYGNDAFVVDSSADRVYEAAGQGSDAVYAAVSFALSSGKYIETLTTTSAAGTGAINLYGNEFAQTINGNNGANVISGGAGNDVINALAGNDMIYGGAGNDRLAGGAGYDNFVFNTAISAATNVDTITDFSPVYDTIRLENAVMPGLGAHLGTLYSTQFWKSSTGLAHDSNDRIIYETDTGWLNYDSNGSAAGGAVHIAKLAPNLALSYADFFVI